MKLRKVLIIAVVSGFIGIIFPYINFAVDETYQQLKIIVDILDLIKENYVEEIKTKKLIYGAAKGMVGELDDFSQFMEPDLYTRVKSDTEGEFGGIGIRIDIRDGWLTVVTPLPNTPAYNAGIYPGDKITKIEGESTKDILIEEAVKKLRGTPGTKVTITTAREPEKGGDWIIKDITLTRELIKMETTKYRMLDKKIGYLKIIDFTGHVFEDVTKALLNLKKDGMEALILDMRYNPGGLLSAAIDVSKLFIGSNKMIVFTKGRKPENFQEFRANSKAPYEEIPVVILVNRFSASASEIVAGAFQDNKRGIVIGEKTFGKASVQSMIPLSDKSALRLTIAKYYTPSGRSIQKDEKGDSGGIIPDIEIKVPREVEIKLIQQADEIHFPGKEKQEKKKEELVKDEMFDRAVEILKAREVLINLRPTK